MDGFGLSWLFPPPGAHGAPDASSDLAALGALLHLLLTGAAPPTPRAPGAAAGRPGASGPSAFTSASSRRARRRLSPQAAGLLDRLTGQGLPSDLGVRYATPAGSGALGTPFRTASELRAALEAVLGGASMPAARSAVPAPIPATLLGVQLRAPHSRHPRRSRSRSRHRQRSWPRRTRSSPRYRRWWSRPLRWPSRPGSPPGRAPGGRPRSSSPRCRGRRLPRSLPGPAVQRPEQRGALSSAPEQRPARPVLSPVPLQVTARTPAPAQHRSGARTRRAIYLRLGTLVGLAGASLLGTLALATLPVGAPGESPAPRPSPAVPAAAPATTPSPVPLLSAPPAPSPAPPAPPAPLAPPADAVPAPTSIPTAAPEPPATAAPAPRRAIPLRPLPPPLSPQLRWRSRRPPPRRRPSLPGPGRAPRIRPCAASTPWSARGSSTAPPGSGRRAWPGPTRRARTSPGASARVAR